MTAPLRLQHISDDRLDDLVDGLLDSAARDEVAVHLRECAACSARLDELRTLLTRSAEMRRPVGPPAELWPLVVASTSAWPRVRRQVLRSLNVPLTAAALVLVVLSSTMTAWVVTRSSGHGAEAVVAAALREDATLDRTLSGRDLEHGPIARERVQELRRRLSAADAALRRAPDDETVYRSLAERERLLAEIRSALGMGPRAPRAPIAP